MNEVFPNIFKRDSTGKIRTWCMELDGSRYRTIAGVQDGNLVTSDWTEASAKNVGRSNETSAEEQALAEIEATYKKKLSVDYHDSVDNVDTFKTFKPMLAVDYAKRKDKIVWDSGNVMMQPKLDGIRCIASSAGLFSRTGKPIIAVPHIAEELKEFFEIYPDVVLDGELYNHKLKADFNKIVSLVRKTKPTVDDLAETKEMVEYHIYDIASGRTSDESFRKRNEELDTLFVLRNYPMDMLKLVQTDLVMSECECDELHSAYVADGYEGSIVRLPEPYQKGKRSNALCKRKDFNDTEGLILSYKLGNGNYAGLPKVIQVDIGGTIVDATMTGDKKFLAKFLDEFDEYVGKEATIQYFGITPAGMYRFPVVKAVHKTPRI